MSLRLNTQEVKYQRDMFMETLNLYGVPAKYYPIIDDNNQAYDMYDDIPTDVAFSEYIEVPITFDEVPQVKTLKSLGWYNPSEILPVIANLPIEYNDQGIRPKLDDKLVIESPGFPSKKFLIKDFMGRGFPDVIYWVCKLVPLRGETDG